LQAAELLVIDERGHGWRITADRTLGIAAQLQLAEAHPQGVVDEKAADERLPGTEDELDGLGCLNDADDAWQHAEYPTLGATRHEAGRRWFRVEAAVAGAALRGEDGCLALEAEDAAVRVGLAEQHARVVDEVARREVVGA